MSSFFGQNLRLSLFGQSHGEGIGITMDGFPAGMAIDFDALNTEMQRRAPGQSLMTTARRETDQPELLSGVLNGRTTGQPLCCLIRNTNTRSADYGEGVDLVRPGHADYTGHVRYYGWEDFRGGGHFSGRLTAPIVFAGALCRQWLTGQGVRIVSHISRLGALRDAPFADTVDDALRARLHGMTLPTLRAGLSADMEAAILAARERQDSIGGELECRVDGVPAGLGAPFFDSVESELAHLLFSVPAVKAVSFGAGEDFARLSGNEANDAFRMAGDRVVTATNHCGGVLGGITTGMPMVFRCTVRATPSIAQEQQTVSLRRGEDAPISIHGRHDPCILPRAVPVIEAMAAIAVMDLWKERSSCVR